MTGKTTTRKQRRLAHDSDLLSSTIRMMRGRLAESIIDLSATSTGKEEPMIFRILCAIAAVALTVQTVAARAGETSILSAAKGSKADAAESAPRLQVISSVNKQPALPSAATTSALANWLSLNIGLPQMQEPPSFEIVSPARITALRDHSGSHSGGASTGDVLAVYGVRNRTIYLPYGWTGNSPAELSILVHEMVHHLQNEEGRKFACPQLREREAFAAQQQWLRQFGTDLRSEFGIDGLTLLVRTNCLF